MIISLVNNKKNNSNKKVMTKTSLQMLKNSNILKNCVFYVKNLNVAFFVKDIVKGLFINNARKKYNNKDSLILMISLLNIK
jgi:hypothetical protein